MVFGWIGSVLNADLWPWYDLQEDEKLRGILEVSEDSGIDDREKEGGAKIKEGRQKSRSVLISYSSGHLGK